MRLTLQKLLLKDFIKTADKKPSAGKYKKEPKMQSNETPEIYVASEKFQQILDDLRLIQFI